MLESCRSMVSDKIHSYDCYRPQPSYGKVMFLHLCVILFTGGSLSRVRSLPRGCICPGGVSVRGEVSVRETPIQLYMGSTHPIGMHFWFSFITTHKKIVKVMFSQVFVCSQGRGCLSRGGRALSRGVSVWGVSLSGAISVQEGVSVIGVSVRETPVQ